MLVALIASACVPSPPMPTQSSNWAGYVIDARSSAQPLRRVAGHFTVPTVTCPAADASLSLWVGMNGIFDQQLTPGGKGRPLYQTGIAAACGEAGTAPVYYAWTEAAPAPAQPLDVRTSPVRPGDVFDTYVSIIGAPSRPQIQLQLVNHGPSFDRTRVLWHHSTQMPLVNGYPLTGECITERATDGSTGKVLPIASFTRAIWGDPSSDGCQVSNVTAPTGLRPIRGNPHGWLVVPMQMRSGTTNALLANVSGFTTLKSGAQAFQVAGYTPSNSIPRSSLGLRTPPTDLRFQLAP